MEEEEEEEEEEETVQCLHVSYLHIYHIYHTYIDHSCTCKVSRALAAGLRERETERERDREKRDRETLLLLLPSVACVPRVWSGGRGLAGSEGARERGSESQHEGIRRRKKSWRRRRRRRRRRRLTLSGQLGGASKDSRGAKIIYSTRATKNAFSRAGANQSKSTGCSGRHIPHAFLVRVCVHGCVYVCTYISRYTVVCSAHAGTRPPTPHTHTARTE